VEGDAGEAREAAAHHGDGLRVVIDEDRAASKLDGGGAGGPAAGEEVEDAVAGVGVDADDPPEDGEGLLGGVAGPLLAAGADDGVPPGIGGGLAAAGLLRADQPRGQVRDPVDVVVAVGVARRILRVPQQVVVLGRPALRGPRPVVVGPDDLVEEGGPAEDRVQQHLAVVHLPVVDVEEERPGGLQQPVRLRQPRRQEPQVVVEGVGEGPGLVALGAVPLPLEPDPVAFLVLDGPKPGPGLGLPRVEGRIDVDQIEERVGKLPQDLQVLPLVNGQHRLLALTTWGRRHTKTPCCGGAWIGATMAGNRTRLEPRYLTTPSLLPQPRPR
jgi:hypothetical protein